MEHNLNMTRGRPMRLLVSFALPLMLGNVFQQLYTVVDTAIVGRGVGMDALAALGTVDWLNWMTLGVAQGFAQGFSVRISQKYGEGDFDGMRRIAGQSAVLSVIIALLCTLVMQVGLPLFLRVLRVPAELWDMAELYTRIISGGFGALMFYNYCASVLRAVGDSKTPLKAMMLAAATNILLDCLAVFVLKWGIAGAAGATVLAQIVAGSYCVIRLRKVPELCFGKKDLGKNRELKWGLVRIGTPIALKNVVISLGGIVVQSIVNGFGMSFIAGFTATNKLYGLLEIAAISYGYAITTYVGQNYGAAKPERIRKGMNAAVLLSLLTSAAIGGIMIALGRLVTMLFISSKDPLQMAAAGETAYLYLLTMCVCLPVLYLLHAYQAGLQGMGKTMLSMLSGVIEFVLRVGIAILIGITGYENGIFASEVLAWVGAAVYLAINYYCCFRRTFPQPWNNGGSGSGTTV